MPPLIILSRLSRDAATYLPNPDLGGVTGSDRVPG
jgi:hypothetical protein